MQDGYQGRPSLRKFVKEVDSASCQRKEKHPRSNTTSKLIATLELNLQIIKQPERLFF